MIDKLRFLPPVLFGALCKLDWQRLQEIRIRADKLVTVLYDGKFSYLSENSVVPQSFVSQNSINQTLIHQNSTNLVNSQNHKIPTVIKCTATQVSEIVLRAAEFSIYAYNDRLCSGYITIAGGIRIGVAGEAVSEGGRVRAQKNFGSLVIRIPHEIRGCADRAYKSVRGAGNKNTLVLSPPGCGKTTVLRDLTRQISDAGYNTLLVDERDELAACHDGVPRLNVGANTDVISGAQKDYAFSYGIRSLRPDYIITDELGGEADLSAVRKAAFCGVNVIASVHACGIDDLKKRREFEEVFANRVFGRYIILSSTRGAGTYEQILNEDLREVREVV